MIDYLVGLCLSLRIFLEKIVCLLKSFELKF